MADIESTPRREQRQRRPPLVGETKLFDGDPEIYVDTKAAVGMINAQFGAITSPADMGAMRISGTGPGFVKLASMSVTKCRRCHHITARCWSSTQARRGAS